MFSADFTEQLDLKLNGKEKNTDKLDFSNWVTFEDNGLNCIWLRENKWKDVEYNYMLCFSECKYT